MSGIGKLHDDSHVPCNKNPSLSNIWNLFGAKCSRCSAGVEVSFRQES